jgi:hypothetical protein
MSNSEITDQGESADELSYESASDTQPDEDDDIQSLKSETYGRRHIDITDQDTELPLRGAASMSKSDELSSLLNLRRRREQISTPKPGHPQHIRIRNPLQPGQRPLMDITPVNSSEEEDDPPDLPPKTNHYNTTQQLKR